MSTIEITRKPTTIQVEALRTGAASTHGVIDVSASTRTHEGLVGRGLADWKRPQDVYGRTGSRGAALCVITQAGRDYLATLDRPETGPADFQDVTDEEIAQGVEDALRWLPWGKRDEARERGAVAVLSREFKRSGAVWRKLSKEGGRVPVETQALRYYGKVQKLLAAARLRERQAAEAGVGAQSGVRQGEDVPERAEAAPVASEGEALPEVAAPLGVVVEEASEKEMAGVGFGADAPFTATYPRHRTYRVGDTPFTDIIVPTGSTVEVTKHGSTYTGTVAWVTSLRAGSFRLVGEHTRVHRMAITVPELGEVFADSDEVTVMPVALSAKGPHAQAVANELIAAGHTPHNSEENNSGFYVHTLLRCLHVGYRIPGRLTPADREWREREMTALRATLNKLGYTVTESRLKPSAPLHWAIATTA